MELRPGQGDAKFSQPSPTAVRSWRVPTRKTRTTTPKDTEQKEKHPILALSRAWLATNASGLYSYD